MMTENNKIRPLVTMMTAALLSSSCSLVGPDYVKPEAEVEPKWINQSSPEISQRTAELSTWWKVFKDPVLDKLVTEARSAEFESASCRYAYFRGARPARHCHQR